MAKTPIIKEGNNGFYPWADIHQKNPYAHAIALHPTSQITSLKLQNIIIFATKKNGSMEVGL
ncbi:MAG TPA: hypothetical protein ENJ53_00090 [Phaeodactylibacter sp.]|nr:hypothetical protein [Phaeodactylibacter sp.]